jgi:hypothetical protein
MVPRLATSDAIPKTRTFLFLNLAMGRPPRTLPPYRRRSALAAGHAAPKAPGTLEAGILSAYPDANPRRLEEWAGRVVGETAAEPEPLLFMALICGVRLEIERDDAESILEQLWAWLTSPPRRMPHKLADLLVEAWSTELRRIVETRGWRFGHAGRPINRQGRPPEARAAWTVALLVERQLLASGVPPAPARELACALAAVLLGRRAVASAEIYRARKRIGNPDPTGLAAAIMGRYESWLRSEAAQLRDPAPSEDPDSLAEWRARHRRLAQLVGIYGAGKFARLVLREIPAELWAPFLNLEGPSEARRRGTGRGAAAASKQL